MVKHLDKLEHGRSGRLASGKALQVGEFRPQRAEKALHHGIVIRVAFVTHADLNAMGLQQRQLVIRRVLAAPIRMLDQVGSLRQLPPQQRHA